MRKVLYLGETIQLIKATMLKKLTPNMLIRITFILLIINTIYLFYQLEKRDKEIKELLKENIELIKELKSKPKDSLSVE